MTDVTVLARLPRVAPDAGRAPGWRLLGRELAQRRRGIGPVLAWSAVEAFPMLASGWLVATAADDGFLAGRPWVGAAWLGAFGALQLLRTFATRALLPRLAIIVEPLRDALVRMVVTGALRQAVEGRPRARASTEGRPQARASTPQGSDRPDASALARLTEQVRSVRGLVSALLSEVRRILISVVTALVGLATLAPSLAAAALGPIVLILLVFAWLQRRLTARQHAVLVADEEIAADTVEALDGIRDVVASSAQERTAVAIGAAVDAQATAELRLANAEAGRMLVMTLADALPLLAALAVTPWLIGSGQLGGGEVLGAVTYIVSGLQPALGSLLSAIGGWGLQLGVTLDRIARTSALAPAPVPRGSTPLGFAVQTRRVTFAYGPHAFPVIRDLSLTVPEGEHLAIVGPSGIGKSTFVDLLTGITEPGFGTVTLGGHRLQDIDPLHRHRRIALIPQESYVFAGTLRDNLGYLADRPGDAEIHRAVRALGLADLVRRVGGYDVELDLTGPQLTAADRQLVVLARVYLSPARVVILDEGTSYLDATAEEVAERAFRERPGTLIVVAHRMSSARRADRILVLDGDTATAGTHDALMSSSPLYRDLAGHWTDAPPAVPPRRPAPMRDPGPRGPVRRPLPWRSRPVEGRHVDDDVTFHLTGTFRVPAPPG